MAFIPLYPLNTLLRKAEHRRYRKRAHQIAESDEDMENLNNILDQLRHIEDDYDRTLDSLSFLTQLHPAFMKPDEYHTLQQKLSQYRSFRFLEGDTLYRIFPDGKCLDEIDSWMERNARPDYIPFQKD